MSQPNPNNPTPNLSELRYNVDGMDCADCARKIETVISRTPGASDGKVNFTAQTLALTLDETHTPRATLERNIRALGYEAKLKTDGSSNPAHGEAGHEHHEDHDGHDHAAHDKADHSKEADAGHGEAGHTHYDPSDDGKAWYNTKQGRLVFISGALLAAAYGFGFLEPQLATWGYIAATLLGTYPLALKAWAGIRFGDPFSINTLVTIAAVGAIAIGEAPEGAVVVFFFAIGELLEGIAAGRARAGIKALAALAPKTALLLENGQTREIPAESLKVGQVVRIVPGARVPCDGTIMTGASSLDDSPVTGESVPVNKSTGDTVFAGSINTDGVLEVRVDKAASDNTIARIIKLVEEAEDGKGQTARFIDRFSRYWTPGVLVVAVLVTVIPPLFFAGEWNVWLYKGISLILIGCPCALVLSVPAAITSGLSSGARRGLLIKGGGVLETIGSIKTIAFDKTGTLTAGKPRVTDIIALQGHESDVLRLAAGVESGSSHPLAKAIVDKAKEQNLELPTVSEAKAIQGKAAIGMVEGRKLAVGSPKYAAELITFSSELNTQISNLEQSGKTVVVLLENDQALALIAIRDEPRDDARQAIAELKALGISSVMLTGDNVRTGKAIADTLGLDVRAELMPEDKLKLITEFKKQGSVAMIGDGINDAPALAASDVGIAMGGGTDVALETANAALLRNSVMGVVDLVRLSRAVMGNIRQNIIFALGLKAIFLVTTMLGLTNLWMAILSDTGATALVTANALRLLTYKPK
jgi:Zn2+/Cd2+-exporting ATPase